ncbi:Lysophospholipase NTE1 [Yarrowia sp. C11]|nr:Lysophospholipase NTE1 [Yarrowia sp. C11]
MDSLDLSATSVLADTVEAVETATSALVDTAETASASTAALNNALARSAYAAHTSLSYLAWAFGLWFLRLIGWVCYGIPTYVLGLLGRTINISLQFSSLLLILIALVTVVVGVVRYKYLTVYSRLPQEQPRQEPEIDMYDESDNEHEKTGFANYFDEFLSAVKIFGYLERPVFHELTRHMQTWKLSADEMVPLDDEQGFSVVVEGTVQVFAKQSSFVQNPTSVPDSRKEDSIMFNGERYTLLSEIKNGAPLTSLFNILSLFTDDLQLHKNFDSAANSPMASASDVPNMSLASDGSEDIQKGEPQFGEPRLSEKPAAKLSVTVRAATDSTIAIIPAAAFRRITKKFPQATAHIVQVILTRFQRVTFQTGHHYFGLTPEIFQTEVNLNSHARNELPTYLREGAVKKLNQVYDASLLGGRPKKYTVTLNKKNKNKGSKRQRFSVQLNHQGQLTSQSRMVSLDSLEAVGDHMNPGDLLTNVPLSQSVFQRKRRRNEDTALRTALVEAIFKVLGIDRDSIQSSIMAVKTVSNTASPMFTGATTGASSGSLGDELRSRRTGQDSLGGSHFGLGVPSERSQNSFYARSETSTSSVDEDSLMAAPFDTIRNDVAQYMDVVLFKKDSLLIKQDDPTPGLYYLIDGVLEVGYTDHHKIYHDLYTVQPGGVGGYIGSILGHRSFADLRARTDVYAGFLPRAAIERMSERYPMVHLTMAKSLTKVLSRLLLHLDFAMEWVQVRAGQKIYKEGQDADAIYIVLNGRVRSVAETKGDSGIVGGESGDPKDGKGHRKNLTSIGEYGKGESVGELEVLTLTRRPSTLVAIRDAELAKIPRALFESLALHYPSITFEISRIVASRVRTLMEGSAPIPRRLHTFDMAAHHDSYLTIAVVPISQDVDVSEFGRRLYNGMKAVGREACHLNHASVLNHMGRHAFNPLGKLKLSGFLDDIEDRYQTVLYVADTPPGSSWTHTCISQADCVLLVADARSEPDIGEYERVLVKMRTTARTEMVLIHPERYVPPGLTSAWLKPRVWVHTHHHVQMDLPRHEADVLASIRKMKRTGTLANLKNKVQTIQEEFKSMYRPKANIYSTSSANKDDFNRLARILSGQAIGLVLGGGGARGISHIGIIKALEDAGIPIDFVGGTSIGSFIGGLYAKEYDLVPIYGRAKKFSGRVSSLWRMALDLTYPATSYTTGHEFNRGIWKAFGDSRIEDFWLRYFTNTTNITHSRMEIHTSGYAWRYIRASMSLAGLLPPLTDNGSMLLDGGYVDNLPVSEMKAQGASVVFAVDVGSIDDTTPMSYGDSLSGAWVMWNRWNPFGRHPNVPNLAEIQARLAYVSSVGALEKAKHTPGVIYMRPPIDDFATLDFAKFLDIYRVGNMYGHKFLSELRQEGKLPAIPGMDNVKAKHKRTIARRNSI